MILFAFVKPLQLIKSFITDTAKICDPSPHNAIYLTIYVLSYCKLIIQSIQSQITIMRVYAAIPED